jgi:long-chain acyl-CoA synthetase
MLSILPGSPLPVTHDQLFDLTAAARNATKDLFRWRALLSQATPTSPAAYSPILTGMTYLTAAERRLNIGRAITALEDDGRLAPRGAGPGGRPEPINEQSGFGVGIWSLNRAEWQLVDAGCHAFSLVGVPLYDTLGPNVVEYIINHSPLSIVFASSDHIPSLLKVAPKCKALRVIVSMDNFMPLREGKVLRAWADSVGVELWELPDFEIWGAKEALKRKMKVRPPRPDQIATISYTSGTTGNPKGVLLTHSAVTQACVAQSFGAAAVQEGVQPVCMSYLPLAHM